MMPQVSCVIPFRDAALWLPDQLAALAGQTYDGPREFIFADNGSRDDGRFVIEAWRERLGGEVAIIDASVCRGVAAVRNFAARHARAPLIAFCDADDRINPNWLAALVQTAEETGAHLVSGCVRPWNGHPGPNVEKPSSPADAPYMGYLPVSFAGNVLIRAEVIQALGGWDEGFRSAEDIDFTWRALEAGYKLATAREAILDYRRRATVSGLFRQNRQYGEDDVRVIVRHRVSASRSLVRRLRDIWVYWRIALRWTVGRGQPLDRCHVVAVASRKVGHLRGSIRYRRLYF